MCPYGMLAGVAGDYDTMLEENHVGGLPFSLSVAVVGVSHGWRYPPFTVTSSSALSPLSLTSYPIQSTRLP